MPFSPNNHRPGGWRPGPGGSRGGDRRGFHGGARPARRDGAQDQSVGHTAATDEMKDILGGERFPHCESASLRLDKLVTVGNKKKLREISDVVSLHNRRKPKVAAFVPTGFDAFVATLRSNLIVNQAGGVLENAGISLHPHFNVPFLPGSAVKGVARHAAWCLWKDETNSDRKDDLAKRIARTFGYPTQNADLDKALKDLKVSERSGSVSFMAAFPCSASGEEAPATLAVDILTPHGGNDWTDPVPNPFPVVAKGTSFKFAVGPAGSDGERCLKDAVRWLQKGLTEGGLGAKTAAGYGAFEIAGVENVEPKKTYTLRLVSPAFLRGAEKDEETLREASLRGVLRYWWRIVFGSVLAERDLKSLETKIWGGAGKPPLASQIVVRLVPTKRTVSVPFDKEAAVRMLPRTFEQNRTTGLAYASYGMDDMKRNDNGERVRAQRKVLQPGAEWRLDVSFRPRDGISPEVLAIHSDLALKALCTYGGVGAKSRKGFGSLDCGAELNIGDAELWKTLAETVAKSGFDPDPDMASSYSFLSADMPDPVSVPIRTKDAWAAVDRIGFALQSTASSLKHKDCKAAIGLPRKIHGPLRDPLPHQRGRQHTPPENLRSEGTLQRVPRFASPLFVHIAPGDNGKLKVNAIAFPSGLVRPVGVSQEVLGYYLEYLQAILLETEWT